VKDGDTWEGIATDKNVDPAVLMLVNNVDPTTAPTPPTPGAMIVIPTQQHDACIAPGPDNSNRVCSDPTPPDLLVITPVSDDVVQGQPLLVEAQNIMTDPAASAFASGLADKPWATVAISGHTSTKVMTGANANYAKADFANAFHAALKSSYKELGAASREDFWARSGIVELGFFRPLVKSKSSHHTLGCAVDLDVRCNPYIAIGTKDHISSENGIGSKDNWKQYFQKLFYVYARAALFTGMADPDNVMAMSKDFRDQAVRFKHVHQALRAYLSIAYDVDQKNSHGTMSLNHPLWMSQDENDGDGPPGVAEVGKCAGRERPVDESTARLSDPTTITYPWYDPKTGKSPDASITKDGLKSVLDSLGYADDDLTKLYYRVRRDHELFRLAIPGPGVSLRAQPDAQTQLTRDPCNGFMWFHPAIPIGIAQAKANIRCLGFSAGVAWGAYGTEAGDIMHFDFT